MQLESRPVLFFGLWMLTFLAMPIGGGIARLVAGPADSVASALLAGLLAGTVIGLAQWLMLRQWWSIAPWWIAGTAAGMAIGSALALVLAGVELTTAAVLLRGLIVGLVIAAVQWFIFREASPYAWLWALVVVASWPLAWFITMSVGVDLTQKWIVFGSTGAIVFTAIAGGALLLMHSMQAVPAAMP